MSKKLYAILTKDELNAPFSSGESIPYPACIWNKGRTLCAVSWDSSLPLIPQMSKREIYESPKEVERAFKYVHGS